MTIITSADLIVRPIQAKDNAAIANLIREVSAEHGLTADKGFTVSDPDLDQLFELYSQPRSIYWVVEYQGQVAGGGGIAPLRGADANICELQKMYFSPQLRGQGLAKKLALQGFAFAREQGFEHCYLETTGTLLAAVALYEHLGFKHINHAMGNTGHGDCEVRMLKAL